MPSDKFEKEDYGPFPVATTNKDVFNKGSTSKSSQLTPNDNKELKRQDCSINYVIKGSTSKSGSRRGVRCLLFLYEVENYFLECEMVA
jgi:hypothetical protein